MVQVPMAAFVRAAPGSYDENERSYPSLRHFLVGDSRRTPSRERDVGLRWRDVGGRFYRAAWVVGTGELVLVQTGAPENGGGHVEVIGHYSSERELLAALAEWEAICGEPCSAEWLRERAAGRGNRLAPA
jgi:hypothetical protein